MNRRNLVVFFLSLTLLTVSILVIYLLWSAEDAKRKQCVYEDLKGEILNYPTNNDSNVIVEHRKELYDQSKEPKYVTIYEYNNYIVTFTIDDNISYMEIKDSNMVIKYKNEKIILNINGTICSNGIYTDTRNYGVNPIISNGKLYFVGISDKCYLFKENEKKPYFEYSYIDLSNDVNQNSAVKIQEMKLKIDDYYGCENN